MLVQVRMEVKDFQAADIPNIITYSIQPHKLPHVKIIKSVFIEKKNIQNLSVTGWMRSRKLFIGFLQVLWAG